MGERQNIYDNPVFFSGYKQVRDQASSLNERLEQPALWSLVGARLKDATVLDLGCGFGNFARRSRELGAARVIGVDLSENMLAEARSRTRDPQVEFRRSSVQELALGAESYDLVVSSLMLHYVSEYDEVVEKIAHLLKRGGRFVFSVEHPMFTARPEQDWIRGTNGEPLYWPVDSYRPEGERRVTWFVDGVVKYHRTLESYVNTLIAAGFRLDRLLEPAPGASDTEMDEHRRRPVFLLIAATRE